MVKGCVIAVLTMCLAFQALDRTEAWYHQKLLEQSKMMSRTVREPIKMPTQTPMVPYKPPGGNYYQFIDLESRLYRDRIMMINKFIDTEAANNIISILLYLRHENPRQQLDLYFNVPGAHFRPALAIYDLICQTRQDCDIRTINLGVCTGMGAILCGAGTKGLRCAMPNSRFLLQRTGMDRPFQGQATDIALEVQNLKKWNDRMEEELSLITAQPLDQVRQDLKRDFYLTSDEAVRYGLIDEVLPPNFNKRPSAGLDDMAELGKFQSADQRYQGRNNVGGWGSRLETQPEKQGDDDDDEPPPMKG